MSDTKEKPYKFVLVQKVTLQPTQEELPYYGHGDYEKSKLVDRAAIAASEVDFSTRKAGNFFKKEYAHLWHGKPFLNATSAVAQWWVEPRDKDNKSLW
jgi:hypothetical protein